MMCRAVAALRVEAEVADQPLRADEATDPADGGPILTVPGLRPSPRRQWLRRTPHPHAKENLLWVRTFHTVEEFRLALLAFKQTYNEHWLIERHGHRSPAQFRRDRMDNQALVA